MFLADIFADTDTDILGQIYRPPIPIPIFPLSRYLADIWSKGRYKPIFWPISGIFNRYLADTDIADIYLADTDTDILKQIYQPPIPIFSLSRYLADIRSKGRYKPIFWPISRNFNRYFADTDIAISIKPIPIPIYQYV